MDLMTQAHGRSNKYKHPQLIVNIKRAPNTMVERVLNVHWYYVPE